MTIRHSPEAKKSYGDPSARVRVQGLELRFKVLSSNCMYNCQIRKDPNLMCNTQA